MTKLLYKDLKLCFNPMIPVFYSFVVMLLIPNYIYQVPFFFTTNAIFYMFQRCVINNDVLYSALLPVTKKEIVRARYVYVCVVQLIMIALYVPIIFVNHAIMEQGNSAGVDANITLIAMGFVVFAIFNAVFLPGFYKTTYKAGKSFLASTIAVFGWIFLSEGFFIASKAAGDSVPFFGWVSNNLDCWPASKEALTAQFIALAIGIAVYAAVTILSLRASERHFEKVDL